MRCVVVPGSRLSPLERACVGVKPVHEHCVQAQVRDLADTKGDARPRGHRAADREVVKVRRYSVGAQGSRSVGRESGLSVAISVRQRASGQAAGRWWAEVAGWRAVGGQLAGSCGNQPLPTPTAGTSRAESCGRAGLLADPTAPGRARRRPASSPRPDATQHQGCKPHDEGLAGVRVMSVPTTGLRCPP